MSFPDAPQKDLPAYNAPVGYAEPVADPGKGLGIAGFVLAFFGPLSLVGVILSIVGLVKSRRAGQKNGLALAGIILSAIVLVVSTVIIVGAVLAFLHLAQTCQELGDGVHEVNGITYTCNL